VRGRETVSSVMPEFAGDPAGGHEARPRSIESRYSDGESRLQARAAKPSGRLTTERRTLSMLQGSAEIVVEFDLTATFLEDTIRVSVLQAAIGLRICRAQGRGREPSPPLPLLPHSRPLLPPTCRRCRRCRRCRLCRWLALALRARRLLRRRLVDGVVEYGRSCYRLLRSSLQASW